MVRPDFAKQSQAIVLRQPMDLALSPVALSPPAE
ncbi:MAG: hypothetical protein RI937_144, partial [Pseudomonadota bacterium]